MSALTDIDFAAVRDFLAAQAGLVFDEGRRAVMPCGPVVLAAILRLSGNK
jgi:hypothetical protein